jgi:hypothetical protein
MLLSIKWLDKDAFMKDAFVLLTVTLALTLPALPVHAADNLLLITLDGLRWQELYRGLDRSLASHEEYSPRSEELLNRFWHDDPRERARALMPFMHDVVFAQGVHAGNRDAASCARLSNPWNFSFPGYSEILSGVVNADINTNAKVANPEKTLLELLDARDEFRDRTAAFASWDVFPWIFNVERSGLHVNAPGTVVTPTDEFENVLLQLSADIPTPWDTVRHDAFTHHYARSWLQNQSPRVLYISYGETDDFAHDGRYDEYIFAAQRTDRFIREMWELVQSMDGYRDNTVMFIAVDHGRGEEPIETWKHHASKQSVSGYMQSLAQYEEGIVGSENVWMAAIGPGVPASGALAVADENCLTSNRIAATVLQLLGVDYRSLNPAMGAPMQEFLQ